MPKPHAFVSLPIQFFFVSESMFLFVNFKEYLPFLINSLSDFIPYGIRLNTIKNIVSVDTTKLCAILPVAGAVFSYDVSPVFNTDQPQVFCNAFMHLLANLYGNNFAYPYFSVLRAAYDEYHHLFDLQRLVKANYTQLIGFFMYNLQDSFYKAMLVIFGKLSVFWIKIRNLLIQLTNYMIILINSLRTYGTSINNLNTSVAQVQTLNPRSQKSNSFIVPLS